MPAPYDYSVDVQSPAEALLKGLKLGSAFADVAARREAEQFKMQQQQSLANAMNTLSDKIKSGTATESDFGQVAFFAPKDQAETLLKAGESMSKETLQKMLSFGSQVMSALDSKNPQFGIDLLNERAQAERNKGNEEQAKAYERSAKLAELDPAGAISIVGGLIKGLPGGDKAIESYLKIKQEQRAQQLAPFEMAAKRREGIPSSIQEAIEFQNLTPEQQKTFQDLQVLKKPPAAVTNVSVTNLEKTASGELAKLIPDLYAQANSAASQLSDIPRYRAALNRAITGPFAEARLETAKIGAALGFTGDKAVNATREVIQGLAEMALKSRNMIAGQGQGPITEGEQKLLSKARSGDITFTKGELEIIFGVAERASKAQYDKSKKLLGSAADKSETAKMFLDNVSELPSAPQAAPKQPIYAVNPQTGQRIMSVDGGNTWTPAR